MYMYKYIIKNSTFMYIYNAVMKKAIKRRKNSRVEERGQGRRRGNVEVLGIEVEQIIFHECTNMSK